MWIYINGKSYYLSMRLSHELPVRPWEWLRFIVCIHYVISHESSIAGRWSCTSFIHQARHAMPTILVLIGKVCCIWQRGSACKGAKVRYITTLNYQPRPLMWPCWINKPIERLPRAQKITSFPFTQIKAFLMALAAPSKLHSGVWSRFYIVHLNLSRILFYLN